MDTTLQFPDVQVNGSLPPPDDETWLREREFSKSAPAKIKSAAAEGDTAQFLARFRRIQRKRRGKAWTTKKVVRHLQRIWPTCLMQSLPLRTPAEPLSLTHCLLEIESLQPEEIARAVEACMANAPQLCLQDEEFLAACWLLSLMPKQLPDAAAFQLIRAVLTHLAEQIPPDPSVTAGAIRDHRVEAALLAADVLDVLKGMSKLHRTSKQVLSLAVNEATDSDGTPHAELLGELGPLLARLARVTLLFESQEQPFWKQSDRKLLARLIERTLLLVTPAGVALESMSTEQVAAILHELGRQLPVRDGVQALLKQWQHSQKKSSGKSPNHWRLPDECHQSDWAEWGVLRNDWSSPVDQCVVSYSQNIPQLELIVRDVPLLQGEWKHELAIDGQPVGIDLPWACCCWFEDSTAAFLELEQQREDGIRVIRQVLQLREQHALLIADSIRTAGAHRIELSRELPLVAGWEFLRDAATREAALIQQKERVRICPLTAPQDKLLPGQESIEVQGGHLRTRAEVQASALYVATLFDWHPNRHNAPVTWQRVTVAEDGQQSAADVASAARVRIGKRHWVFYHALQVPRIPRTFLGLHSASETVAASMNSSGEAEILVEVELPDS